MNDLISRQAVIDDLDTLWDYSTVDGITASTVLKQVRTDIMNLPAVQERKGRWIHDGYDFPGGVDWIHCSECGKRGINVPADLPKYCPCCGARMEGAEDDPEES